MKEILLCVDVGNTATDFGVSFLSHPSRILQKWIIFTSQLKISTRRAGLVNRIDRFLKKNKFRLKGIVVSNVVPLVTPVLRKSLQQRFHLSPFFVSGAQSGKVKVVRYNPREVGADRIVNARAAMAITRKPSIVIDFGTATTFDCITTKGEYLGGVIAAGPLISAEALNQRTARLPFVRLDKSTPILGRSTRESIQAGLYFGYQGLVKEILFQLRKKMGSKTKIFVTGGQAPLIMKGIPGKHLWIPDLTLHGLGWLWKDLHG